MKYDGKEGPDLPPLETCEKQVTQQYKVCCWAKRTDREGNQTSN